MKISDDLFKHDLRFVREFILRFTDGVGYDTEDVISLISHLFICMLSSSVSDEKTINAICELIRKEVVKTSSKLQSEPR